MDTNINPEHYTVGTKVRIPERYGADGGLHPAIDTVITKEPWKNTSGIWVCRVATWGNVSTRVEHLELITP